MRELYDQSYIDSGCTLPYDATTKIDSTAGTYLINFAIAVVGIIVTYKISSKCDKSLPLFFALTSVGHILAGIGHIIVQSTEDSYKKPIEMVSYIFIGLGASCMFYYSLKIMSVTEILCNVVSLLVAIITVYAAIKKMMLIGILGIVNHYFVFFFVIIHISITIRKKWCLFFEKFRIICLTHTQSFLFFVGE